MRDAIDGAGFVRATGNTVWWGNDETRVESFTAGARGWQVTNRALTQVFQDSARAAGVDVIERRATVDDVRDASFVLDCTGRHGLIARARGWRVHEATLRTVALVGTWRRGSWPVPDPTHTLIESYANGWAWSVPVANGDRYVAVMVDPRVSRLDGDDARAVYLEELRKTRRFRALIADARLNGGPSGWDASMYSATRYADDRILLVGDAASFIDPLSSAGIKKALASAWLAAVAVHTALAHPPMRQTALNLFAAREAEIYASFRQLTAGYLAAAAAGEEQSFWSDRANVMDPQPANDHEAVQRALDQLRAAPRIVLRRGKGVRIEPRAAVSGSEIVLEPRITAGDDDPGVRFVRDVDVVALIELAPGIDQVPDLFDVYCRRYGPVALTDFVTALSTAVARGWLQL